MEFWGIEVKPGETVNCSPGEDKYLHLSQAALGDVKKGSEPIPLFVHVDGKKLVLGTLSNTCNHISFDLVFEKGFGLSHNSKNGSVYFCGYQTVTQDDGMDDFSGSDSEEDIQLKPQKENGNLAVKSEEVKPILENSKAVKSEAAPSKAKVKITEPNKDTKPTSDDDDDDDDTDEDEDEEDDDISEEEDVKMLGLGEDDDDSDEDDDDEDESSEEEETPKKDDKGKKRVFDSAARTPVSEKKAKHATPVASTKTDGKKGGHTATPYPKKAGKTPANLSKGKPQTPVSQEKKPGIQASCKTCNRTFNSDQALQSHNKAKHSGGK